MYLKKFGRSAVAGTMAVASLYAAACSGSDARTEKIVPGISRDSALAILRSPLSGGPPVSSDSNTNVWRTAQYFMKGKNVEIIWYSPANEHWSRTDTIPKKRVIPVVVVEGMVVGAGKPAFDKAADEYLIKRTK